MTTTSEPPSRAFPVKAHPYCESPSPADHPPPAARPLTSLLPSITAPLSLFERINLSDTCEVMRAEIMRMQQAYCLIFSSPDDGFPLGYVARKLLAVELLTGNRPDVLRLVTVAPCLPVSISIEEALRVLIRKHAELGVLCDLDGEPVGLCRRESLLRQAEVRL